MRDQLRSSVGQFVAGATHPSLPALAGTILVAVGLFVVCLIEVSPRTMANPAAQVLVKKSRDQYGHLTLNALRLRQSPPQEDCVVIIGDSMIYQAIPRPQSLEQDLRERIGGRVAVRTLAAGALTQWEAIVLTDSVQDWLHGVVVLEITPFNLSMGGNAQRERIAQPRLAIDSPSLLDETRRAGQAPRRALGNYFLDHYSFFATRVDSPFQLPAWYSYPKHGLRTWTDAQWSASEPRFTSWVKGFERESPHNLEIYGRMIARLKQNPRIKVALLEGAENPRNQELAGRAAYAKYRMVVTEFARREGVPYLDISAAAQLEASDFADYAHLASSKARARYAKALAEGLAEVMKDTRLDQGGRR